MRPRLSTIGRPAGAIEIDRFEPSVDTRAGEHDDRVRALKGLVHDEVPPRAAQEHGGSDHGNHGDATAVRRMTRRIR